MNRRIVFLSPTIITFCAALFFVEVSAQRRAEVWPTITKEARPWTRWWWHGSAVTKEGITSELEALHQAGLGGVEVTPIYGVVGHENKFIPFLSEQWVDMLLHTLREADRIGLGVDIATGTGWPFGGPWVSDEHACKTLRFATYEVGNESDIPKVITYTEKPYLRRVGFNVPGKTKKNFTLSDISHPVSTNANLQELAIDQVQFPRPLHLISLMAFKEGGTGMDLTKNVDARGNLRWRYPGGKWKLYALFEGFHGKMVERAGPGGEGNVIDHFSKPALPTYLSRFDSAFKDRDITSLRAFFNDSYEVDDAMGTANWTPDFLGEFQKRKGYRLQDHLPKLLAIKENSEGNRVLSDYRETISDLLLENFTRPWSEWGHKKSALIRNQAHGSPANILDLYATVDIPEIEGIEPLRIKMASSAGNVTGKKLVSAEAATWLDEHFQSNLYEVKENLDRFMLNGVNHLFYHGTAYSPAEEAWPGWLFYAAVHFNPRNPLWNDFATLNHYVARCQSILQNTVPHNDVLLYYPVYDRFAASGKEMIEHFDGIEKQFQGTSFFRCAEDLLSKGYTFDYISDRQVQSLTFLDEMIITEGKSEYKTIVIPHCKFVPVATLKKILTLAKAGAKVVWVDGYPESYPGLADSTSNENAFNALTKDLPRFAGPTTFASYGKGLLIAGKDIVVALSEAGVVSESVVQAGLLFLRKKDNAGNTYYMINNPATKSFEGEVMFSIREDNITLFDPLTGQIGRLPRQGQSGKIFLKLKPRQTVFLELSKDRPEMEDYQFFHEGKNVTVTGPWTLHLTKGGPDRPPKIRLDTLSAWTDLGEAYERFSGEAAYTTSFTNPEPAATTIKLDLGVVKESASVYLNGQYMATLIGPEYSFEFPASVLREVNELKIIVCNGMANRIRYLDREGVVWKKFYNINFPARRAENSVDGIFNASAWSIAPSGLIGPVRLIMPAVKK